MNFNLNYAVFTDSEWVYPDFSLPEDTAKSCPEIFLETARSGHDGCQLILDTSRLSAKAAVRFSWESDGAPNVSLYEMLPVTVNENTSPTLMTTLDYESCREFVTRQPSRHLPRQPSSEGNRHSRQEWMTSCHAASNTIS